MPLLIPLVSGAAMAVLIHGSGVARRDKIVQDCPQVAVEAPLLLVTTTIMVN